MYLKYFEEVYIRLPINVKTEQEENDKIYLKDLISKNVDYSKIKKNFQSISIILSELEDPIFQRIKEHIDTNYPIILSTSTTKQIHLAIIDFYYNSEDFFLKKSATNYEYGSKSSSEYIDSKNVLKRVQDMPRSSEIVQLLNEIEYNLDNVIYTTQYNIVNEEIRKRIGEKINVPNNDYIQYFIENEDVLMTEVSVQEMDATNKKFGKVSDTIYVYIVYISFVVIFALHFIFAVLRGPFQYMAIIIVTISLFLTYIFLKKMIVKSYKNI